MSYKKEMNEMNGRKLVYGKFKLSKFLFSFVVFLIILQCRQVYTEFRFESKLLISNEFATHAGLSPTFILLFLHWV